jgi:molecular chaperone DnaJ
MQRKTHYMILGVSDDDTSGAIRAAYRDRVKRLHPYVAGPATTRAFQEVTEAYSVLSDPARRRDYDEGLQVDEGPFVHDVITLLDRPEGIRPSFEALYDRILRNATGWHVPKAEHPEGINFDVLLTPDEAARGCVVPVGVPCYETCPTCRGTGRDWMLPCWRCGASGTLETEELVEIALGAGMPSGSVFEVDLARLGILNCYLRLHVFVTALGRH